MRSGIDDDEQFEVFLEDYGGHIVDQLAVEINRLEERILEAAPQAKHVDLEAD